MPLVSFISWTAVCKSIPDEKSSLDSDASQRRTLPYTVVLPQKKEALGRWSVAEQIAALHSSPMFFVFLISRHSGKSQSKKVPYRAI